MNFLSHFYFDRYSPDSHLVLGTVLPDLISNSNKAWKLHPEKRRSLLSYDPDLLSILEGWNRHMQVDRYFHCSEFFLEHSKAIRLSIVPFLEESPVRPSFLSHIALELMLDSLLITNGKIDTNDFYSHLKKVNRKTLTTFFDLNDIPDTAVFFQFLDKFIDSAYLKSYSESQHIMYAINRICMRLWDNPLSETQKLQLTSVLIKYKEKLQNNFMDIFNEINAHLKYPQ
jgi:hypothetical protein